MLSSLYNILAADGSKLINVAKPSYWYWQMLLYVDKWLMFGLSIHFLGY
jgi:hypothetical protein